MIARSYYSYFLLLLWQQLHYEFFKHHQSYSTKNCDNSLFLMKMTTMNLFIVINICSINYHLYIFFLLKGIKNQTLNIKLRFSRESSFFYHLIKWHNTIFKWRQFFSHLIKWHSTIFKKRQFFSLFGKMAQHNFQEKAVFSPIW